MAIRGARAEDGRITPHLMVRGGRKAIEFYTRALGATMLYESPMPHGSGLHAHLMIGRTMIMVTDEQPSSAEGMALGVAVLHKPAEGQLPVVIDGAELLDLDRRQRADRHVVALVDGLRGQGVEQLAKQPLVGRADGAEEHLEVPEGRAGLERPSPQSL